jgi:hypothetical protein
MNSIGDFFKKGAPGILSAIVSVIGWVQLHQSILPIPSSWGLWIGLAGTIATTLSHSPLPSTPDGK